MWQLTAVIVHGQGVVVGVCEQVTLCEDPVGGVTYWGQGAYRPAEGTLR